MRKTLIVANWKSHKTPNEAEQWLKQFRACGTLPNLGEKVVICPAFTALERCHDVIQSMDLPLALGAQDISPFADGAYTGAVSARMLRGVVDYVIIGHSERRSLFHEDDTFLKNKVDQALMEQLTPIYCIQHATTVIPPGVTIAAYEPLEAIGSGHPDTPEHAENMACLVVQQTHCRILYGGSVKADNVASFLNQESISGVLVGGASLDPLSFYELIQNTGREPKTKTSP